MGCDILLLCAPLDANGLVGRLERLLCLGVQQGVVEEIGSHILEMVISDKIASLELEIALQLYHKRVNRLNKCLAEFRHSQELS
ncbi:hypothetical protein D1007_01026 [Hordeum vulgare]|nr:hypothetical protein D1007_01026 [Hordeum vulgare]